MSASAVQTPEVAKGATAAGTPSTEAFRLPKVIYKGREYFTMLRLHLNSPEITAGVAYAYIAGLKAGMVKFFWRKGAYKTPFIVAHTVFTRPEAIEFSAVVLETAAQTLVLNNRTEGPTAGPAMLTLAGVSQQIMTAHIRRPNVAIIRGKPVLRKACIINPEKLEAAILDLLTKQVDLYNNLAGFYRTQNGEQLDPISFAKMVNELHAAPAAVETEHIGHFTPITP